MHKKYLILQVLLVASSLTLSSCNDYKVREDVQKYYESINYDKARKNTHNLSLTSSFEVKENNEITSYRYTTLEACFDKDNYFLDVKESYKGVYAENDLKEAQKKLYIGEDGKYYQYTNFDGQIQENVVDLTVIENSLTNVFYSSEMGGLKTGGLYYGDDIKQLYRFQEHMKIDENTGILTLTVNHFISDGVDNSYSYSLNKYGMLLNYDLNSFNEQTVLIGKIVANYY